MMDVWSASTKLGAGSTDAASCSTALTSKVSGNWYTFSVQRIDIKSTLWAAAFVPKSREVGRVGATRGRFRAKLGRPRAICGRELGQASRLSQLRSTSSRVGRVRAKCGAQTGPTLGDIDRIRADQGQRSNPGRSKLTNIRRCRTKFLCREVRGPSAWGRISGQTGPNPGHNSESAEVGPSSG